MLRRGLACLKLAVIEVSVDEIAKRTARWQGRTASRWMDVGLKRKS